MKRSVANRPPIALGQSMQHEQAPVRSAFTVLLIETHEAASIQLHFLSLSSRHLAVMVATVALLLLFAIGLLHAYPGEVSSMIAPAEGPSVESATDTTVGSWSVSTRTGSAEYAYPIDVPEGRLGMTPSLALVYSSQAPIRGGIAAGWSLPIQMIEVDTRASLLTGPHYRSSLGGGQRLVEVKEPNAPANARTFRAESDGTYVRYEYYPDKGAGRWRALLPDGTTLHFGERPEARDEADTDGPGGTSRVGIDRHFRGARWFITRNVDPFGNTIAYNYDKVGGFAYNGRVGGLPGPPLHVDIVLRNVYYTSNEGVAPHARVAFSWSDPEACAGSDVPIGAQFDLTTGLRIYRGATRLLGIQVQVRERPGSSEPWRVRRVIDLGYDLRGAGPVVGAEAGTGEEPGGKVIHACNALHAPLRLLTSIRETAWSSTENPATDPGTSLPAVTFSYGSVERDLSQTKNIPALESGRLINRLGFGLQRLNRNKAGGFPTVEQILTDFDGDGRTDIVRSTDDPTTPECDITVENIEDGSQTSRKLPTIPWANGKLRNIDGNINQIEGCNFDSQFTRRGVPPEKDAGGLAANYNSYDFVDLDGDGQTELVSSLGLNPGAYDATKDSLLPYPPPSPTPVRPCIDSSGMAVECLLDRRTSTLFVTEDDGGPGSCPKGTCPHPIEKTGGICDDFGSGSCCRAEYCDLPSLPGFVGTLSDPPEGPQDDPFEAIDWTWPGSPPGSEIEDQPKIGVSKNPRLGHTHERFDGHYVVRVHRPREDGTYSTEFRLWPVPLISDRPVGSLGGGRFADASSWHGAIDIDGDGRIDLVWQQPSYIDRGWEDGIWDGDFQVFRGDGKGGFHGDADGRPYRWRVPKLAGRTRVQRTEHRVVVPRHAGPFSGMHQNSVETWQTMLDVNGDGRVDFVAKVGEGDSARLRVFFNTGSGFEKFSDPSEATLLTDDFNVIERTDSVIIKSRLDNPAMEIGWSQSVLRPIDWDHDGQTDVMFISPPAMDQIDPWAAPPTGGISPLALQPNGAAPAIVPPPVRTTVVAYINVGDRFVRVSSPQLRAWRAGLARITVFDQDRWQTKSDVADLDNDGLLDVYNNNEHQSVFGTRGCTPDKFEVEISIWSWGLCGSSPNMLVDADAPNGLRLLARIDNGRGGQVTFEYAPPRDVATIQNPQAPGRAYAASSMRLVARVISDPGEGQPQGVTDYSYRNPVHNVDRFGFAGFRGFEQVTIVHPPVQVGATAERGRTVEHYGYRVHHTGYLARVTRFMSEKRDDPATIEQTKWAPFTLFGGGSAHPGGSCADPADRDSCAVISVHATESRAWTCNTSDPTNSEKNCMAAAPFRRTVTGWRALTSGHVDVVAGPSPSKSTARALTMNRSRIVRQPSAATSPAVPGIAKAVTAIERETRLNIRVRDRSSIRTEAILPASSVIEVLDGEIGPIRSAWLHARPVSAANAHLCGPAVTVPVDAVPVMYVHCGTHFTDSADAPRVGDRVVIRGHNLRSAADVHHLLSTSTRKYEVGTDRWRLVGRARTEHDALGFAERVTVWSDADTPAVLERGRYPTGNIRWERSPRHVQAGTSNRTSYWLDPSLLYARIAVNEIGQVVLHELDIANGATTFRGGPYQIDLAGYPGTATEVDGLGRPRTRWFAVYNPSAPPDSDPVALEYRLIHIRYDDTTMDGNGVNIATTRYLDKIGKNAVQSWVEFDGADRPRLNVTLGATGPVRTRYTYDKAGNITVVTVTSPNDGPDVEYRYQRDTLGRIIRWVPPMGSGASEVETKFSGLTTQQAQVPGASALPEERPSVIQATHDVFGRLRRVVEDPNGVAAITTYDYNANDQLSVVNDASGQITRMEHDFVGRRTLVRRYGRTWCYDYDFDGNLIAKTPPRPGPADTGCEKLDAWTTLHFYDAAGREAIRIPARRHLTDADLERYGMLRPLADVATPGASPEEIDRARRAIVFEHDLNDGDHANGTGRLGRVRMPFGTIDYSYTREGQIARQQVAFRVHPFDTVVSDSREQRFTYNAAGQFLNVTHADHSEGPTVTSTTYDRMGLPEAVYVRTGFTWRELARVDRNRAGLPFRRTSSGQVHQWRYDLVGRVLGHSIASPGMAGVGGENFQYDSTGNIRRMTDVGTGDSLEFRFDSQQQLIRAKSEASSGYAGSFSYLPNGSVSTVNIASDTTLSDFFARNVSHVYSTIPDALPPVGGLEPRPAADPAAVLHLKNASGAGNRASFTYDDSGNMTKRTTAAESTEFVYDGEDRLREAIRRRDNSTGREVYYYAPDGARLVSVQHIGDRSSARLWFGATEVRYRDGSVVDETRIHVALGRQPVAQIRQGNVDRPLLTYHGVSGSLLAVLDSEGGVRAQYSYGPFGEVLSKEGPDTDEHKRLFNGKEFDELTGLSEYGFRYYDGLSLSWTSMDPIYRFAPDLAYNQPRRMGLYTFVLNNPLRYVDPDGKNPVPDAGVPTAPPLCSDIAGPYASGECIPAQTEPAEDKSSQLTRQICASKGGTVEAGICHINEENFDDESLTDAQKVLDAGGLSPDPVIGPASDLAGIFVALRAGDWYSAGASAAAIVGFEALKASKYAKYAKVLKYENLPSWKKIDIDIDYIVSGHMRGGDRLVAGHGKSLFPDYMSKRQVKSAVRNAYRFGKPVKTQAEHYKRVKGELVRVGEIVKIRGESHGLTIEMYLDVEKRLIESAYPIF